MKWTNVMSIPSEENVEPLEVHFNQATPAFRVRDLDESVDYYCDVLGFQIQWNHKDRCACISRGACTILLTVDAPIEPGMWVRVAVSDVPALFDQYLVAGAKIASPPTDVGWGLEMQVEDLAGNILRLGSHPAR
ncbi:glyoxalase superfamily protein [Terriglobus sp. RCC_193]|uniref:glyoxalase superfamily protein n=1 Tax=Terriglobus sp. RCC_193 TaxID=3239218 RepID=UPI0035267831